MNYSEESERDGLSKQEKQNVMKSSETEILSCEITRIERIYEQARYQEAYEHFNTLCAGFPEFQDQAAAILSQYNDLNNQIIAGVITLEQQNITKQQIGNRFKFCVKQFKNSIQQG